MPVRISSCTHRTASLAALGALAVTGLGITVLPAALAETAVSTASGITVSGNASVGWTPTVSGTGATSRAVSSGAPDNVVRASASVEVRPGYARASVTGLSAGGIALPSVTITCTDGVIGAPQISGKGPGGKVSVSAGRGGIGAVITLPGLTITAGKVACGKNTGGGNPTTTPKPTTPKPTNPPTTKPGGGTGGGNGGTGGGAGKPTASKPTPGAQPPRVPAPKVTAERNPGLSVTG